MTITLPSRIAAAAVIAPLALLAAACGDDSGSSSKDAASDPATSASSDPTSSETDPSIEPTQTATFADPAPVEHVVDGFWLQADGDAVRLPTADYFSAVIWNGQLVATRVSGEVFAEADVIAEDGTLVRTFETTGAVAVNEAGTTIAWVDTDGVVQTAWDGDSVSLGEVDLAAPGETVAYTVAAVVGGPSCYEVEDGCQVFLNSGLGEPTALDSHGIDDNPYPFVIEYGDVSGDGLISYVDTIEDASSCGGLIEAGARKPRWETCDFEAAQVSPDGRHVIGLPSYYDGLGLTGIDVLDAETGESTGRYGVEGGFIAHWAWSADGSVVFDAYDGAQWHLFTMTPQGEITEIGEPVAGEDVDSPYTLIQH